MYNKAKHMPRLSTIALLICLSVIWVNAINKVATYVVTQQQITHTN